MAAALAFGPLRENIDKSSSKLKELKQYYHTNDLKNRIEENIKKLEGNLISANKCGKNLINASCFFIIALFLMFVFDTYGELYTKNLCFELMDVIITGSLSIVSLIYLGKGAWALKSIYSTVYKEKMNTKDT